MQFGSRKNFERSLLILDGVDHFTAAWSDSNGEFPQRCDVYTAPKNAPTNGSEKFEQLGEALDQMLMADTDSARSVFFVSELAVHSAVDAWYDIPPDFTSRLGGPDPASDAYSRLWNHFYDHHARRGSEQFHIKLQQPSSPLPHTHRSTNAPIDLSGLKFRVLSLAGDKSEIGDILDSFNDRNMIVQQLFSRGLANAFHISANHKESFFHLEIGWFSSEIFLATDHIIQAADSVPLGLFHFAHDLSVGLDLSADDAILLLREHGWNSQFHASSYPNQLDDLGVRERYKEVLEARLQEYLRIFMRKIQRISPNHQKMWLSISGMSAPGLKEIIRLVVGGEECESRPIYELVPRFLERSHQKFSRPSINQELSCAIAYIKDQRRAADGLRGDLANLAACRAKESPSALGWLKEMF